MKGYNSLRFVKSNCSSIWKYMTEHICKVKFLGQVVYEGEITEGVFLKYISEDNASMYTVECYVNPESTILLTVEDNPYIEKIKSLGKYEDIMEDSKKMMEAFNMSMRVPTIEHFSDLRDKVKFILEDGEEDEGASMDSADSGSDYGQSMNGGDEGKDSAALGQDSAKEEADTKLRSDVQFKIFTAPDKQVDDLKEGEKYLKIEYIYKDKKKGIEIDFLIGRKDDTKDWALYTGKIGSASYDDDPYKSLKTKELSKAINNAVQEVVDLVKEVEKEPDEWLQFYIHR